MQKTAIIFGATGLTGSLVLEQLLADENYTTIKLFSRKASGISHPKVKEYNGDLLSLETFKEEMTGDEVYICIGTTKKKTPDHEQYRKIDLGQIKKDIRLSMERMVEYRFIWTDLYNLLKNNERIFAHFSGVHKERIAGNLFLFNRLIEMGLMRSSDFKNEYEMLSERMINFGDTWIYTSELYRRKSTLENIEHQSKVMIAMIYPYLTEEGRHKYSDAV